MRRPFAIASASLFLAALYACSAAPTAQPGVVPMGGKGTKVAKKGNPTSKGKKGGSGKDSIGGSKASSTTVSAASRSGNKDEADNDCKGVADGDAICKGSSISLCMSETEYFLECGAFA